MNNILTNTINENSIVEIYKSQKKNALAVSQTTANERIQKLKKILSWISTNEALIQEAMFKDFKKHPSEVLIGEILGVNGEIKHLIKHLKSWMKPSSVPTPLNMVGSSAYVKYEAKGVCLIISPWNYPFNLAIKPLVQAIAAGNTVILKPSEMTPHTSALTNKMLTELFEPNEIAVVEGDANVSTLLLSLPFNHIFFTGSPAVGKIVMTAAAKHLASVTLELGGKSPCVIDETANIKKTAEKLAWGKFLNNGQTCIAPDYVLVHESVKDELVENLKKSVEAMYNPDGKGIENSIDYCRIVNARHYNRVNRLLADSVEKGANIAYGGKSIETDNYVSPTILTDVNDSMAVMQEEIFGPILPIIPYKNPQDVVEIINNRDKPLAMYINSSKSKNIDFFMNSTSAGGTVINDSIIHYGHSELPFGGVNNSGIGKSGGIWGFLEFSNQRAVLHQKYGTFKMIFPPYTPTVKKLINFIVKYL